MRTFLVRRARILFGIMSVMTSTACKKERSAFESNLMDKRKCWAYYTHSDVPSRDSSVILGCTKFYDDNTFQSMSVEGNMDKPAELHNIDGKYGEQTWSFSRSDSSFQIGESKYQRFQILSYNGDTVTMKNSLGETHKLVNLK